MGLNKQYIFLGLLGVGIGALAYAVFKKPKPAKSNFTKCSNLQSKQRIEECVADSVKSFLSENINGISDCANIQVSVGLTSTNVSFNSCK